MFEKKTKRIHHVHMPKSTENLFFLILSLNKLIIYIVPCKEIEP